MFILKKEATFTYPIVYFQPADGGTKLKQTFDAIFKILPQSRINELSLLVEKKKKEIDKGIFDGIDINDEKVADEILVGWKGIEADGGKPFTNTVARIGLRAVNGTNGVGGHKQVLSLTIIGNSIGGLLQGCVL